MVQQTLLQIVDTDADIQAARAEAQKLLRHWTGGMPPDLQTVAFDDLDVTPSRFTRCPVVLICGALATDQARWDLLAALQESHTPTMWLVDGESGQTMADEDYGMVVRRAGADPRLLCATLEGLYSQSPVIAGLRAEVKLLRAHQGGLADQIGKIDEELRLASQLQKEFLPTELPGFDGVAFNVLWRPAGYVSGDVYDVFRLDERHIGFFLADAVGHGVPAALMTVFIKRSLNTKEMTEYAPGYRVVEPGEALHRLNRDMITQHSGQVRFATACYGVIDTQTRRVRLARAGHPYPMLLRADGATEMIDVDGGLLGVFPEEKFEQAEIDLAAGDRLLLYSDGFEMAFPDEPDDQGNSKIVTEHYTTEFLALREETPEKALRRLGRRIDHQAGSLNQRDDLTILCLSIAEQVADAATTPAHAAA